MRRNKKKKLEEQAAKFNRGFVVAVIAIAVLVFGGSTLYSKKYGRDKSIDRNAVDEKILVKSHSPIKGLATAKVTVVEFVDPECESCRKMHPILKQIEEEYRGQVRIITRYLPLHGNSRFAAFALEEARELGKYDQALDILFEMQPMWGSHHNPRPELIVEYLSKIGIGRDRLDMKYLSSKHQWKIDLDETDARTIGIRKTPSFFVNGQMLYAIGYDPLKQAIDSALVTLKE